MKCARDANGYSSSPYAQTQHMQQHTTPLVARGRNLDLSKYFDEFWDDSASQKVRYVPFTMLPVDEQTAMLHFLSCTQ